MKSQDAVLPPQETDAGQPSRSWTSVRMRVEPTLIAGRAASSPSMRIAPVVLSVQEPDSGCQSDVLVMRWPMSSPFLPMRPALAAEERARQTTNTVRCGAEAEPTSRSATSPSAFFVVTTSRPFTLSAVPRVGVPFAVENTAFDLPPRDLHDVMAPVAASKEKSSSREASSQ